MTYRCLVLLLGHTLGSYCDLSQLYLKMRYKEYRATYRYMVITIKLQHTLRMLIGYPHLPRSKLGLGGNIFLPRIRTYQNISLLNR